MKYFCAILLIVGIVGCAAPAPQPLTMETAMAEASTKIALEESARETLVLGITRTAAAQITNTPMPTETLVPTKAPTMNPEERQAYELGVVATAKADPSQYFALAGRDLVSYPEKYKGYKVAIKGAKVFHIIEEGFFQVYLAGTYDAVVIDAWYMPVLVYENSIVDIYGEVYGKECFQNSMGADICQPKLWMAAVDVVQQ